MIRPRSTMPKVPFEAPSDRHVNRICDLAGEVKSTRQKLPPEPSSSIQFVDEQDDYAVPPTEIVEGDDMTLHGTEFFDMRVQSSNSPIPAPAPIPEEVFNIEEWRAKRAAKRASRMGEARKEFKRQLNARIRWRRARRLKRWLPISHGLTLGVLGVLTAYCLLTGIVDYPIFIIAVAMILKGISLLVRAVRANPSVLEFIELSTISVFLFVGLILSFVAPVPVSGSVRDFGTCGVVFYLLMLSKSKSKK